jgi:lysophospholipase L1-like esterase
MIPGSRFRSALDGWCGKILLLALSTGLCLAAAELYVRRTSPYIIRSSTEPLAGKEVLSGDYGYFMDSLSGRRLIPRTQVVRVEDDGSRMPISINGQGFRDVEIPAEKEPGETRILMLGDSITFGAQVRAEATYPKRTEAYLNADGRRGTIRCINGGVEGIGTKDEIDILREQGLAVKPDIVVVGFYLNDGMPPDRFAAGLADPGFLRRHSVLAQTIYRAYKYRQYAAGTMEEAMMYGWETVRPPDDWRANPRSLLAFARIAARDWGSAWDPDTWIGIEQQMRRLRTIADENGFHVVVAGFPIAYQAYTDYIENEPQRRMEALCRKYGFRFIDLLPLFRSRITEQRVFLDYCHLTEEGHDIVGKALAGLLAEGPLLHGPGEPML